MHYIKPLQVLKYLLIARLSRKFSEIKILQLQPLGPIRAHWNQGRGMNCVQLISRQVTKLRIPLPSICSLGKVQVWFSLQLKFSSFELDSEVGRLVELYCHFEFRLYVILRTRLTLFLLLMLEMASLLSTSIGFVMPSSILSSFLAG